MNKTVIYILLAVVFFTAAIVSHGTDFFDARYKASFFMGGLSGAVGLALLFDVMLWWVKKPWLKRVVSIEQMITESNKIIRDKEATRLEESAEKQHKSNPRPRPTICCPHCDAVMPKFDMYCSNCGKDRKAR